MDYYAIGQRIRKYRKALGYSQEYLAEQVGISIPHMSHIETGNTKLSLPVIVAISTALDVHIDDLVFETTTYDKSDIKQEISEILDSSTADEAKFLLDSLKSAKANIKAYKIRASEP